MLESLASLFKHKDGTREFVQHSKIKLSEDAPILLPRLEEMPEESLSSSLSHMTVVTTSGRSPEMHDQQEDRTR